MDEDRISRLSSAKRLSASFSEDRRSIYWDNGVPRKDFSRTTSFAVTERQANLANHKRAHSAYTSDRPSPIWPISKAALQTSPTPRCLELSTHKQLPSTYQPCKEVMTNIPASALRATPSPRVAQLSAHKTFSSSPGVKANSEWDWGEWSLDISAAAKKAEPSARVLQLSMSKVPPTQYRPCREVRWPVLPATRSYVATESLQKLARPRSRSEGDYNPSAYNISRGALVAQPSPRITQLATPLSRKCRTKK
ncbi:hypothetical protein EMCRGX_G014422 [Ephydatia muelleri]